jgi:N-acetyl-anhydromuramyl-L-alanine amidase AmpD
VSNPRTYLFDLPEAGRPASFRLAEEWYPGVRDHWQAASSSRSVDALLGIKAVVIHATAGASSSGAMSVLKAHNASWHWLVPDEDEQHHGQHAWACIPEARAAWHVRNDRSHPAVNAGRNRINHWSLGVEIVNTQSAGATDPFSEWQVRMTAEIVRHCWAKYPNLKHVVSHAVLDPDRRTDPGSHFPWDTFRDLVLSAGPNEAVTLATPMNQLVPDRSREICC